MSHRSVLIFSDEYHIISNASLVNNYNIDRPRAMNAEAIVDSQNCRITLYVVDWIIILTICLCCLQPDVPILHVFGRRNDKKSLYISPKREKLSIL